MVKTRGILLFLFCIILPLKVFSQDVEVTSAADQYAVSGTPIQVTVTITHPSTQKVDPGSFKLGKDSIKVEFLKQVKLSDRSDLILSIYNFTIPPEKSGLHYLAPVTVTIGGKEYTSDESTYNID